MNCPYCNNSVPEGIAPIVRNYCFSCFGKPAFHDWNQIDYDEFLLTDLDVEFSLELNNKAHLVYFNPTSNQVYIYRESQPLITVKANELITPDNVLQLVQRVLNMKAFL